MEPYRLTATQAVSQIQAGTLTVSAYVTSLLSRIEQRDEAVQAWAYLDRELVLRRARELDVIPPGERGPLYGVVVGVKDVIYTKDMPTQHNSPIYKDDAPALDAGCVAILRSSGALILRKTTTTEFAATITSPATRNPHDPARTLGGSMIRPASFNGVYALKPTWGAISPEGLKVYSLTLDTLGLYARSAADLELLGASGNSEAKGVSGMRFAVLKNPRAAFPDPGLGSQHAITKAVALLREHGATVDEIDNDTVWPDFDQMPTWHRTVMTTDGRVALDEQLAGQVENKGGFTHKARLAALDGIAALQPRVDQVLQGYEALLTPSVPDEAPVGFENTGSAAFNSVWRALHVPVVNVPGFQGEDGLPVGVSLVAPRYRDRHLVRVRAAVGEIFEAQGGWRPKNHIHD
ncbi:amidase [Lasiosphaeria miniovina]|uniref:Amidase n=1 Tax=Lasiosphaeria miniovina TaxID=1954250 RepID=A0AA40DRN0_9PEZI|nr:amidase [Lasiosphaeria miniovina]KAK0713045.1 amidase [Lasiosphaeria miniovina]